MSTHYFGIRIDFVLRDWFQEAFLPELREKYGDDVQIAAIVAPHQYWAIPEECFAHLPQPILSSTGGTAVELGENVRRKLRFVLRTGLPSSFARQRPDLVEPGDFPWAGAGVYKGYVGGVSGLNEESDWWAFERIVDRLIELRTAAALPAIQASKDRIEGWKYLEGGGNPPQS